MFGDCTTPAALTIGLLLSLLAYRAAAVRCWSSNTGLLKHPSVSLQSCGERHIGCHEHYHTLKDANTVVYDAGCGPYILSLEMQVLISFHMEEEKNMECFTDGCNVGLISELEASHRVCHWANRGANFTSAAIACARSETRCYLDSMTGAKEPAHFAGCGACPSYTLYCSTCTSNYCNNATATDAAVAAAPVGRRTVNVDNPAGSSSQARPSYSFDTEAAPPAAARGSPVAIATLAALALLAAAAGP